MAFTADVGDVRGQAEIPLVDVKGDGLSPRWLPLYAKLGDEVQREDLGKIRVAAWLGPGADGRLEPGASVQTCAASEDWIVPFL